MVPFSWDAVLKTRDKSSLAHFFEPIFKFSLSRYQFSNCSLIYIGILEAQNWPKLEILWPENNLWKFPVARASPMPKPLARNLARTMKKVAQPSPNLDTNLNPFYFLLENSETSITFIILQLLVGSAYVFLNSFKCQKYSSEAILDNAGVIWCHQPCHWLKWIL